jgi:hypothetical protein
MWIVRTFSLMAEPIFIEESFSNFPNQYLYYFRPSPEQHFRCRKNDWKKWNIQMGNSRWNKWHFERFRLGRLGTHNLLGHRSSWDEVRSEQHAWERKHALNQGLQVLRFDPYWSAYPPATGNSSSLREVALLTNAVIKFALFCTSMHVDMSLSASSALIIPEASKLWALAVRFAQSATMSLKLKPLKMLVRFCALDRKISIRVRASWDLNRLPVIARIASEIIGPSRQSIWQQRIGEETGCDEQIVLHVIDVGVLINCKRFLGYWGSTYRYSSQGRGERHESAGGETLVTHV